MPQNIKHITVIGAGAMGSQIAMVSALAGFATTVVDISQTSLDQAKEQLWSRVTRDVEKGRRSSETVRNAKELMQFSTNQDESTANTDFVIEAAIEDLEIKRKIFSQLNKTTPSHAVLTTNSSNIMSSQIADATNRPDKVCNMHFFNPALVMSGVEVVPHSETSNDTVETVVATVEAFGKEAIELKHEVPGFVANRLVNAIRVEAMKLYDTGVADIQDIDRAARSALRHPMGPFELMDLVGIDVAYLIRMAEFEQTGDETSKPHPVLAEKYATGDYGRKVGRGWYDYA